MREGDVIWSRWDEVDALFEHVMSHPAAERRGRLQEACPADPDLRAAVGRLLDLAEARDPRSDGPGAALMQRACAEASDDPVDLPPGARLGRYRLVGVLGRGGMATVYEAERDDGVYRQNVALKVLRRGLDTDGIVRRFLAERQILSDFAHPNIARLLDGGATPDGRPFLVMEKVEGLPITEWADAQRLDVEKRLRLFLQVTDAVQEAHRRLVVHRDLKPSNILVDASGRVKLLDFGIAKLLEPGAGEGDLTRLGPHPLTRRYASPEQARGDQVTTSADVFQLGLILAELLVGRPPEPSPPAGALPGGAWRLPLSPTRLLAEVGPDAGEVARRRRTTPRLLLRRLRGDVETIVATASEEEPLHRYRSVEDLALDIRLHLEGQPIRARPTSRLLRVRKWVRRNRWAPPVAVMLAIIGAGYVGTLRLSAARLEEERNEARAQAARAERIQGFLVDLFRSADPFESVDPGASADLTVADALAGAAERVRTELSGEPAMQADLLAAVASIMENLDRTEEAARLIEEALVLRRSLGQAETAAYASDLGILAQVVDYDRPDSAVRVLEHAVTILRSAPPRDRPRLADALAELLWIRTYRYGEADPLPGLEALGIYERAGHEYDRARAGVLATVADVYVALGRQGDAEAAAREALDLQRAALGDDHASTALAAVRLAGVLDAQERYGEAIPLYRSALAVLERTAGRIHNQTLATRNNLATTLQQAGRLEEAVAMHREVLADRVTKAGTRIDRDVAGSLQNLAVALEQQGRFDEADSLAVEAYRTYASTTPEGHYLRAFPLLTRTGIMLAANKADRAASLAEQALAILEPALPGHYAVDVARCRLAAARSAQGRAAEAAALSRSALDRLEADARTPDAYLAECRRVAAPFAVTPSGST